MLSIVALASIAAAISSADARQLRQTPSVVPTTATTTPGLPVAVCNMPQAFSACGYEAFSEMSASTLSNTTVSAWAEQAIETYIRRKGWLPGSLGSGPTPAGSPTTPFQVIDVQTVCSNSWDQNVHGMTILAEVGGTVSWFQAWPYGSDAVPTPDFDCVSDLCIQDERIAECDNDNDDDDDDDDDQ